jgi:hypothetical protein
MEAGIPAQDAASTASKDGKGRVSHDQLIRVGALDHALKRHNHATSCSPYVLAMNNVQLQSV